MLRPVIRLSSMLRLLSCWLLAGSVILPCAAQQATLDKGSPSGVLQTQVSYRKKTLLFSDDFSHGLDSTVWITEMAPAPSSSVTVQAGQLVLDTKAGVTVWLNKLLEGNILIEYRRTIVLEGGVNDRLSDCNQFWMASDPRNSSLFTRQGVFESYDSLLLYYAGIGGNTNTTTRFRKYAGDGQKPLLQEYTDTAHLLQANRTYTIQTIVYQGTTQVLVGGVPWFTRRDSSPLTRGYFGFRSTWSRQRIDGVRIYRLE